MKIKEKHGFYYPKLVFLFVFVYVTISLFSIIYFLNNLNSLQMEYLFPIILLLVIKYFPIVYNNQNNNYTLLSFAFPIVIVYGIIPIIITNLIGFIFPQKNSNKLLIKRLYNSSKQIIGATAVYLVFNNVLFNEYLHITILIILSAFIFSLNDSGSLAIILYLDKKYNFIKKQLPSILEILVSNILNGIVTFYLYAEIGVYGFLVALLYAIFLSLGVQYQFAYSQQKNELHKTEQSAQAILDTIDYGVITFDLDAHITSANPIALQFLKQLNPDPIGKKVEELKPFYSKEIYQFVLQTMETKKVYQQKNVPTFVWHEQGYYDIHTYPMKDTSGKIQGVLLLYRNVTEEQFLKRQFVEADKLTRLGQIAASKVHEIRNPLTTVRGYLQFLRSKIMKGEEVKITSFDVAIQEIDRTNELISSLLILSRHTNEKERILDLRFILIELIQLFKFQLDSKNIQLEYQLDEELMVLGNENNLKQIFINLIINAIDAVEVNHPSKGKKIKIFAKKLDKQVIIALADNGVGIPEKDLQKLNLPFFSTKNEGTGLGLYVTYQLIEEHHGTISVNSIVDSGTDITICFPLQT